MQNFTKIAHEQCLAHFDDMINGLILMDSKRVGKKIVRTGVAPGRNQFSPLIGQAQTLGRGKVRAEFSLRGTERLGASGVISRRDCRQPALIQRIGSRIQWT